MKTLIETLFELLITLVKGIFELICFIFQVNTNEKLYDHSQMLGKDKRKLFSRFNRGLLVNGKKRIPLKLSVTHTSILGASGRGKTSSFFIPNLLKAHNQPFIVTDLDGGIFKDTSGYLARKGYLIQCIDFKNVTKSVLFNPITLCLTDDDLKALSEEIITSSNASGGSDKFWEFSSIHLLYLLLRLVKTHELEYQNLSNVRHLLTLMETPEFSEFVANHTNGTLWNDYLSFKTKDVKLRTSIEASLSATLDLFSYAEISHITSGNTLDFARLIQPKSILYIKIPEIKLERYSLLISILYAQIFKYIQTNRPKKPVFFLLDEAGNYKIKNLSTLLSILRKHNASISIGLQDISQLKDLYNQEQANIIINNTSTKIIYPGASLSLAQEVSKIAGQKSVEVLFEGKVLSQVKPVLTSTEIIQMKQNRALFLVSNFPPVILKMFPYYKQFRLKRRSKIKPLEMPESNFITPPLIPLTKNSYDEEN